MKVYMDTDAQGDPIDPDDNDADGIAAGDESDDSVNDN